MGIEMLMVLLSSDTLRTLADAPAMDSETNGDSGVLASMTGGLANVEPMMNTVGNALSLRKGRTSAGKLYDTFSRSVPWKGMLPAACLDRV